MLQTMALARGSTARPDPIAALPYPVRNMLRRWRGMVGMMIGVGIALGIGMTLLGMAKGTIDVFTIDFQRSAADVYVVQEGGKLIPSLPSDSPGTIKDASHVLSEVRRLPDVRAAVGLLSGTLVRDRGGPQRHNEPAELVVAIGVDGDPQTIPGLVALEEGRWVRRGDEIVLGRQLSREKSIHLGDTVRLSGKDMLVVGIGRLRGLGTGFRAAALAYVDAQTLRQRTESGDVDSIIVADAARPAEARRDVARLGDLTVLSPDDLAKQTADANATSISLNWMLITLTLAIAGLFVSNMLGRSVIERRMEFATLQAIGIPGLTILLAVGAEAILVSLVAGVLGTGFSLALGAVVNHFAAPAFAVDFIYAADGGLILLVFVLALALGIFSGLFPARQAMRVDPADVLREA
jgi:ABC-type antimicrobial peptide transport system permease subunit